MPYDLFGGPVPVDKHTARIYEFRHGDTIGDAEEDDGQDNIKWGKIVRRNEWVVSNDPLLLARWVGSDKGERVGFLLQIRDLRNEEKERIGTVRAQKGGRVLSPEDLPDIGSENGTDTCVEHGIDLGELGLYINYIFTHKPFRHLLRLPFVYDGVDLRGLVVTEPKEIVALIKLIRRTVEERKDIRLRVRLKGEAVEKWDEEVEAKRLESLEFIYSATETEDGRILSVDPMGVE
jgi:hypothetical protein